MLAMENSKMRYDAARDIYATGVAMVEPALDEWRTDREFDELLVRSPHEFSAWRTVVGIAVKPDTFEAIRKATFQPATKAGQPVAETLDLAVLFRIYSKRTSVAAPTDSKPGEPIKPGPYSVNAPQAKSQ